jgi:hypothetical protein
VSLPDFCGKAVAACVVGQWTTTSIRIEATGQTIPQSGGAGVKLHIDPNGGYSVTFDGMQPITATITGIEFDYVYTGSGTSVIRLPADASATEGAWDFIGPTTHTPITLTIRPHDPGLPTLGPFDLTAIGSDSGLPVGKTWQCSGDTLTLAIPVQSPGQFVLTFARTGAG